MIAGLLFLSVISGSAAEPKRVLIVHSFGTAAPPFTTHSSAFEAELIETMGKTVDLDEVSLDMARYAHPDMQEALVDYLQKRQAKWQPDLVVPIGSPAGIFLAQNRERLFPNTPILYCGMDRRRLPADALGKNAAFVGEDFNLPGFVKEMLTLAPATKHIAVVTGASPLERYWVAAFRKTFEPYAGRIDFIWLNELPFDQMLERLGRLPPDSYIFFTLLLRDATGVTHDGDEALQRIHAVANAPINGIFQHQLGMGIVGGSLYQAEKEGIEAAQIANRILNGEAASTFPPKIIGPLTPRYDWRELQRWKIPESRLPAGSAVLYRKQTFWEEDRWWLLTGASICLVETLLIFALLANRLKRRRAEDFLSQSEQRFQDMADNAPVFMWMSGPDKLCTFLNKAWLEFTGHKIEEDLGNGWSKVVHPDDYERCLQAYATAFNARGTYVVECRFRRYDGEYRSLMARGVPRYDTRGNFLGYVGASVDITDLLQKDKELRESGERVALAAATANLGVWEFNTITKELWVSDKIRHLFQLKADEQVDYEVFQSRLHPDDRAAHKAAVARAIEEGGGYEVEYRILPPDGNVRWIAGRARCVGDENKSLTRLLGVSMDITERKQAQELFRLATEASPSGTLLVNDKGDIVLLNAHIEDLFGYNRGELIGKKADMLLPERFATQHPFHRAPSAPVAESRAIGEGSELFARRKNGSEFPVQIGLNSVQTPDGVLILASIMDISARKAAEEEERSRREEFDLLSRLSLLGEMTASLAHELNQPLSAIISNASAGTRFMEKSDVDREMVKEILHDVGADAHRAYDIIRNVRNTVKKGGPVRQAINLNEVIQNVVRMVHPDATLHDCEVKTSLAKHLPPIQADPVQIQQVLVNLVSNAFDAMREVPAGSRRVELLTKANGDGMVEAIVQDHGPGIPEGSRDRIFEHFFTTKDDGLGMGLAIVRSIIESHGGSIAAKNGNDGGACFHVSLPSNGKN